MARRAHADGPGDSSGAAVVDGVRHRHEHTQRGELPHRFPQSLVDRSEAAYAAQMGSLLAEIAGILQE